MQISNSMNSGSSIIEGNCKLAVWALLRYMENRKLSHVSLPNDVLLVFQ